MKPSFKVAKLPNKKRHYELPAMAKELMDLMCNASDSIALMQRYGGTYLDVPKNPDKALELAAIISRESVVKLCAYYGGSRIAYVPKWESYLRIVRACLIYRDCKTQAKRAVALKYDVSVQTVYETCKRWEEDMGYR